MSNRCAVMALKADKQERRFWKSGLLPGFLHHFNLEVNANGWIFNNPSKKAHPGPMASKGPVAYLMQVIWVLTSSYL